MNHTTVAETETETVPLPLPVPVPVPVSVLMTVTVTSKVKSLFSDAFRLTVVDFFREFTS